MKNLVVYHANCNDGLGAAWAAHKALGDAATYFAAAYNRPFPMQLIEEDTTIYLCDFSYPTESIMPVLEDPRVTKVVLLDHHKTALDAIFEHPKYITSFATSERSGAVITHKYFHPEEEVPELLLYVEDRDLWKFAMTHTREVMHGFSVGERTIAGIGKMIDGGIQRLLENGTAIQDAYNQYKESIIRGSVVSIFVDGLRVPGCNANGMFASEIGNDLCINNTLFSVTYFVDRDNNCRVSLRSAENGSDVSAVAKKFGGGGHKHASGFSVHMSRVKFEGNNMYLDSSENN